MGKDLEGFFRGLERAIKNAPAARRQRRFAANERAKALRLREGGFDELAEVYLDSAARHDAIAERLEQGEEP